MQENHNDYNEIKAGVEGVLSDVPEPSAEEAPHEETVPTTTYAEEAYSAPTYSEPQYSSGNVQPALDAERVHEIVEAIVNEKWNEVVGSLGNLAVWKEKVTNDTVAIKQELVRVEERFRDLQNAVLGRVKEYDEGIRSVHTEMKALEKVFEKILEPLTSNIKELTRITQELKRVK